jgi:hypothetical protein
MCDNGASRIRFLTLKFQAPRSLSPHLTIFLPYALSCSSVALDMSCRRPLSSSTPLPHPGLRARRRLDLGLGARRRRRPLS